MEFNLSHWFHLGLGFHVFKGHCSLEVKAPNAPNKGTATLKILNDEFGEDWEKTVCAIYVGDVSTPAISSSHSVSYVRFLGYD